MMSDRIGLESLFVRRACGADIYLDAISESDGCAPPRALLNGDWDRLDGFLHHAHRDGLCDADFRNWSVKFGLANVAQEYHYSPACYEVAPTLIRSSKLINIVTKDPVDMKALWLMQGFPHSEISAVPRHIAANFPFPSLVRTGGATASSSSTGEDKQRPQLSASDQMRLIGNGMQLAQVGTWIAFCFSTSRWSVSVDV